MSSSGGGAAAPVNPVYTDPVNGMTFTDTPNGPWGTNPGSGAAALNAEIAQRQAAEKVTSNTTTAAADQTKVDNEAIFQKNLGDVKTQATTNANQYFTQQGYDPNKFATEIANAINTSSQNVFDPNTAPTTATATPTGSFPSIGAAFSPNLGASILQAINSGDASKATNALSSVFSPTYSADNITNDWLTPATSAALSSQFDPLTVELQNAQKRGTLNDTGYAAAQKALSADQTKATATVNNLGSNILANDRTKLDTYITGAKNDAASVNANTYDTFDPNKYASGATDIIGQAKNNFAGDLSNAIGSTSFADLPSLLNAGGSVQGASDPTATNPTAGIPGVTGATGGGGISDAYIAQQALANQKRGLGSQGPF